MSDTCQGTNADGSPCAKTPLDGSAYCQWHGPDDDQTTVSGTDMPKSGEDGGVDGVSLTQAEETALSALLDVIENATGPGAKCRAAEAILEHVRWQEEQG